MLVCDCMTDKLLKIIVLCFVIVFGLEGCATNSTQQLLPPMQFLHVAKVGGRFLIENQNSQVVNFNGVNLAGLEDQIYQGATDSKPHYPINPANYDGKCVSNDNKSADPPICELSAHLPITQQNYHAYSENDFAQIRYDGFNLVRLAINWSEVEPKPGYYSQIFLNRLKQIIYWSQLAGIYVIIDMHQDGYSRFLPANRTKSSSCVSTQGQDGAPSWAVIITDNVPNCEVLGQSFLDGAESAAWMNFWMNTKVKADKGEAPGVGLQDHYIGALAFIAKAFKNNPTVAGYEIMNEPFPGIIGSIPIANPYVFTLKALYPFYARVIEALTGVRDRKPTCPKNNPSGKILSYSKSQAFNLKGELIQPGDADFCSYPDLGVDTKQLIVFEPEVLRDELDFSAQDPTLGSLKPFSSYSNLVFAPHIYSNVFTVNTLFNSSNYPGPAKTPMELIKQIKYLKNISSTGDYPPNYLLADATSLYEATELHAALLATEYGSAPSVTSTVLSGINQALSLYAISAAFWVFKENCQGPNYCNSSWGLYDSPKEITKGIYYQNGPLRFSRLQIIDIPKIIYYPPGFYSEINDYPNFGIVLSGKNLVSQSATLMVPYWLKEGVVNFSGSCKKGNTTFEFNFGLMMQVKFTSNFPCYIYVGSNNNDLVEIKSALNFLYKNGLVTVSDVKAMNLLISYAKKLTSSSNSSDALRGKIILSLLSYLENQ